MRYTELSRLWTLGGAVAAIGVLLAGWFLVVAPQWQQIGDTRDDISLLSTQNDTIALRNAELRQAQANEEEHTAALERARVRLPSQPVIADFGKRLEELADGALVTLSRLSASDPRTEGEEGDLFGTSVSFTVLGTGERVEAFLASLLETEQRALRVSGVDMLPVDPAQPDGVAGDVVATVSGTVWTLPVLPAADAAEGDEAADEVTE